MDKNKEIEEMAFIALKNTLSYTCAKQIAINFYNAGYRKVPEDNICEAVEKTVNTPKRKYESIEDIVRGFVVKDGKILYVTNILDGYRHEFKDIHEICDELNNSMKEIDRLMELNDNLRFQLDECKNRPLKSSRKS